MDYTQAVVGNKYKVIGGGNFSVGDIVTMTEAMRDSGYFKDAFGVTKWKQYVNIEPHVEARLTPAQQEDFRVGDKFEVVDPNMIFDLGDIVTLTQDDGSSCPLFKRESDGETGFILLSRLERAKLTQLQQQGVKVGDKYVVQGGTWFNNGEVVTLVEDDGSMVPLFENKHGERHYKDMANLVKYDAEKITLLNYGADVVVKVTGPLAQSKIDAISAILAI